MSDTTQDTKPFTDTKPEEAKDVLKEIVDAVPEGQQLLNG